MIQIRGLTFAYQPGRPVLDGIDLDLRPGEHVSILGPNGSGKSTFLKCVSGLLQPTTGTVRSSTPDTSARVGLVFQNPDDQIVSPIVESEIAFGLENAGVERDEMLARVGSILDRFDLTKYRTQDPHNLSGGERQRLAIASILVTEPDYVLFDEPYSMLDPAFRSDLQALIGSLATEGVTPIVVSQDPDTALDSDRLIVLEAGRVVHDGPPTDILSAPSDLPPGLATSTSGRLAVALGWPPPVPVRSPELLEGLDRHPIPEVSAPSPRPHTEDLIVEIHALRFAYDQGLPTEHEVLNDLSLSIRKGEIVSLMGPSGSGKSTLVLHLNGLHIAASGSVRVAGLDAADTATHDLLRQRVGLVFQFPENQLFAETVREDVAYGPTNLEMVDIDGRVERAIEAVGLVPAKFLDRNPLTMSGGEKRRIALAGVLATEPELLVLDEPNAGLDPSGGDDLDAVLRDLNAAGTTIVIATHDLARAAATSDRIVGMLEGGIAVDLPVGDFLRDPSNAASLSIPVPPAIDLMTRLSGDTELPDGLHTTDQLADILTGSVRRR